MTTQTRIKPLDPRSPAGIAMTESLTDVVAALQIAVAARRRARISIEREAA